MPKYSFQICYDLSDAGKVSMLKHEGVLLDGVVKSIDFEDPTFPHFVDLLHKRNDSPLGTNYKIVAKQDRHNMTSEEVLDAVRESLASEQAAIDAMEKAMQQEAIDLSQQPIMDFVSNRYGARNAKSNPGTPDSEWAIWYPCSNKVWERDELATMRADLESLVAEHNAKIVEAKQLAVAEEKIQRSKWIAEHGSDRLKRLVKEGITHESVYIDERVSKDLPGWRLDQKIAKGEASYDAPRNCKQKSLDLLDEARLMRPNSILEFCTIDPTYNDVGDEDTDGWRGVVATDSFEGHKIVYGCTAE